MNVIESQLAKLKKEGRLGLMTHLVVGYPSLRESKQIVLAMADSGADFIELQIPFSDPLADGPTIMNACDSALKNGVKVADAFELAKSLHTEVQTPLLFMCYYNSVFNIGVSEFCKMASEVGISGLIVPDIPLEEEPTEGFLAACLKNNLYPIRLISPVSTTDRLVKNAKIAQGFVYCSARQGITGANAKLDPGLVKYLKRARSYFKIPLAVGFGISSKERVNLIAPFADIVIVGSAIIDIITRSDKKDLISDIKKFIKSLEIN